MGPGRIGTYIFSVPVSVSPDEDDPPCKAYIYHSAVDLEKDVNAGLVGPALICKQGHYNRRTDRQVITKYEEEEEEEVYYPRNRAMEVEGILHSPYINDKFYLQ